MFSIKETKLKRYIWDSYCFLEQIQELKNNIFTWINISTWANNMNNFAKGFKVLNKIIKNITEVILIENLSQL